MDFQSASKNSQVPGNTRVYENGHPNLSAPATANCQENADLETVISAWGGLTRAVRERIIAIVKREEIETGKS